MRSLARIFQTSSAPNSSTWRRARAAIGASLGSYKVSATLASKGEVPAPKAPATAKGAFSGTYKENATGAVLSWKLSFSGLSGRALAAHIHKGKPGRAGPVIVPLCGPCKAGMTAPPRSRRQ